MIEDRRHRQLEHRGVPSSRVTTCRMPSLPAVATSLRPPPNRADVDHRGVPVGDRRSGASWYAPLELAGARVERDGGDREQVRARPHFPVVVGTRIADRDEQRAGVAIERVGHPRGAATVFGRGGILPCIRASLVSRRNQIEAPRQRAVSDIERHHAAVNAPIGLANVDDVVPDDGRRADALARRSSRATCRSQSTRAGLGVERVEEPVLRAPDDAPAGDGDTFVGRIHFWTLRDVLMTPELRTRGCIYRVGAEVRGRVENAVIHDRSGREGTQLTKLKNANGSQLRGVARVDLVEQRVARATIALVVHQPGGGRRVGAIEVRLRWTGRRQLRERAVEFADFNQARDPARRRTSTRGDRRIRQIQHTIHRRFWREHFVTRRNPLCARMYATMSAYSWLGSELARPSGMLVCT